MNQLINKWVINWISEWIINWISEWIINWIVDWIISWINEWIINWISEWIINWIVEWIINWINKWIINWINEKIINWVICKWWKSSLIHSCPSITELYILKFDVRSKWIFYSKFENLWVNGQFLFDFGSSNLQHNRVCIMNRIIQFLEKCPLIAITISI